MISLCRTCNTCKTWTIESISALKICLDFMMCSVCSFIWQATVYSVRYYWHKRKMEIDNFPPLSSLTFVFLLHRVIESSLSRLYLCDSSFLWINGWFVCIFYFSIVSSDDAINNHLEMCVAIAPQMGTIFFFFVGSLIYARKMLCQSKCLAINTVWGGGNKVLSFGYNKWIRVLAFTLWVVKPFHWAATHYYMYIPTKITVAMGLV